MASSRGDDESLYSYAPSIDEEVGPTDGYFNSRYHPQAMYVDTRTSSETSKHREASVESLLQSCLSSSSNYSGSLNTPTSSSRSSDEETPLLGRATPPPAYSTRHDSLPARAIMDQRLRNTDSFPTNTPFWLAGHVAPQNMRDADINSEQLGELHRPSAQPRWRRCVACCSTRLGIIAITILAVVAIFTWNSLNSKLNQEPKVDIFESLQPTIP
jgi:hypothetical protein